MKIQKSIIIFSILILTVSACGSGQILGPKYELVCDVTYNESYLISIEGEEGGYYDTSTTYTSTTKYSTKGNRVYTERVVDFERTYSESGNIYIFSGIIMDDYEKESVSYEITATSDHLEDQLTCKSD